MGIWSAIARKIAEHLPPQKSLENLAISRTTSPFDKLMARGWQTSKYDLIRGMTDWAYMAINVVSQNVATSKWRIVKRTDHTGEIQEGHPVYEFIDYPNPEQTWTDVLWLTAAYLSSVGSAYWWMAKDGSYPNLQVLSPDAVSAQGGSYLYARGRMQVSIPAEEMCVFVRPSILAPDGSDGMSPLAAGAGIVQSYLGMRVAEWNSWQKAIIDNLIVMFKEGISENAAKKILAKLDEASGANHAGKLLGLGGVEGTERIGISPKDIVNPEMAADFRRSILALWGVNEQILGIDTTANRATSYTSQYRFVENSIKPLLLLMAAKINHRVGPWYWPGDLIYFDPVIPYPEDWERELQEDKELTAAGIITINEVRERKGLDPVAWGDTPLRPISPFGQPPAPADNAPPKSIAKSPLDPRNEKARRFSDTFVRFHARYEKQFAGAVRAKVFAPTVRWFQERLKAGKSQIKGIDQDYLDQQMYELYRTIVVEGAGKQYASSIADAFNLSFDLNQWRPVYERFAKLRGREFWHDILNRSREVAEAAVQDAVSGRVTFAEALTRIESEYGEMRALRIARTETAGAMNGGAKAVYQMNGVRANEWVASLDDLVRDAHREANGQVRRINEPFDVGGEALEFPGDPKGSPENIINCRCALSPALPED